MNSKRKCKYCGEYSRVDRGFIAPDNSFFCIPNHAVFWAKEKIDKQREKKIANLKKREKKEIAKQKRDFRAQDTSFRRKAAQKAFNAYIRKRDEKLGCISCDKPHNWQGQWHAGHLKTVGARGDIRFNEDNVNKQCSVCNNHLSGNVGEYEKRLIERIGKSRVEALSLVRQVKRTAEDYKAIETEYKKKLKELNESST